MLVAVNLYLEAVTAASRIEVARAQQADRGGALPQASDLKAAGLVAGIDVVRAQVQMQNQRQRSIAAENDFEKAKLQLARAIGLPPGQIFTLTDTIPFAPLADVTLEDALARAYEHAPTTSRRGIGSRRPKPRAAPPAPSCSRPLHVDADYGTIGRTVGDAHPDLHGGGDGAPAALRGRHAAGARDRDRRAAAAATGRARRLARAGSTSRCASSMLDVGRGRQQLDAASAT